MVKPDNPHSQEIVERIHRTVRNGLICEYLKNGKNFNIKESLNKVVLTYNNMKHRTINSKPVDIFYSKDNELLLKIKENTINSS